MELRPLLAVSRIYDSSSSRAARVFRLEGRENFYLKTAASGTLATEAEMTHYFWQKRLGPEVVCYLRGERDWLLTRQLPGEDCLDALYCQNPARLCDTLAQLLRQLHETPCPDCPVPNRCETYRRKAMENHQAGIYDEKLFPGEWGFASREEAWKLVCANGGTLRPQVLLHGDYCLPNIILDDWRFSGFIDLDCAGVGDRHIDLFWGVWTLFYNLKTNAYYHRFLDAYGRELVEPELLRTVAAFEVFG